FKQS
ncbi:sensory box protein, partial [Vibrio parahaemolyticus V-223/04]